MSRRLTPAMRKALRRIVKNELIGARSFRNYNARTANALRRHGYVFFRDGYMIPTALGMAEGSA